MTTSEIPSAVAEYLRRNPSVVGKIMEPDALKELAAQTEELATWCVACGASHGAAPRMQIDSDPGQWTDDQIDALARRLQERTR